MENIPTSEQKKFWESPQVVVYGDMTSLTQQNKNKTLGDTDDFATVPGLSSV